MVPSWWITIEAAAMASSMASRRFAPAARAGGQVGGHGVAGADDVDLAADGVGRHVLGPARRAGAYDALLGQGHEDGLAGAGGEISGMLLHGVDSDDRSARHPRRAPRRSS